jgi:hypothetical protein
MISAPVFKKQQQAGHTVPAQEAGSPVQGRVKELKTTWEERLSPKKDDSASCKCCRLPLVGGEADSLLCSNWLVAEICATFAIESG